MLKQCTFKLLVHPFRQKYELKILDLMNLDEDVE